MDASCTGEVQSNVRAAPRENPASIRRCRTGVDLADLPLTVATEPWKIFAAATRDRAVSACERYAAAEQMAVQMGFQAEFSHRERRTWWDSLVDGLNRLPRPLITFGVIGLFVWAVADPPTFSLAMLALQNLPEILWYIFLADIGFWFGTKMIEKAPRRMEGPTVEDVKRVHDLEAERRYQEEMADTSKPLTNAAIMEWNRRRKNGT